MDELERRLRSALTEMAEEVPPSHNAWAEQERRLALKSRPARVRPALLAAVAAAVVALVAIPVTLLGLRSSDQVDHATLPTATSVDQLPSSPNTPQTTNGVPYGPGYRVVPTEKLLVTPTILDSAKGNTGLYVVAYAVQRNDVPRPMLCTALVNREGEINGDGQVSAPTCVPIPASTKQVWLRTTVQNSETPGIYLYVANPKVNTILLRRGESDAYREAYVVGTSKDFVVLVGRMNSQLPPKAYTARDKSGADLENGE
jgi:hypothetical protein